MRIEGDIKVWIDGDKACARLSANGPEGPIVVHASAPLAPIRRNVERMFARRGVQVAGTDTAFKATVKRLGRKKALRRLQRLAPAAFQRGGLAPYLAREELKRRGKQRLALAAAGTPVGSKVIGRLKVGRKRARHLAQRMRAARLRLRAGRVSAGLLPAVPKVSAIAPAPRRPALPALGPAPGGGGVSTFEEAAALTSEQSPQGPDVDEAEPADPGEAADAAETDGPDEEGAPYEDDTPQGEEGDAREGEDGDDVSGDEALELMRRQARAREHIRAAMRLLVAARHDPSARHRVRTIVSLAGEGDPKATKAARALAVASRLRKRMQGQEKPAAPRALPPKAAAQPVRAALPPLPKSAPAGGGSREAQAKWWDVLGPWRRGIG